MATTAPGRTLSFRGAAYPLVLPSLRDPRLHVAAVVLTVHALGQTVLHFQLTIPQIVAAILTCAVIEVVLTFHRSRSIVWPASAMLTGSGVALVLRVVGTPADDPWNTYAWDVFAIVAGLSLLSKYVIRYRGSHVFNPSNLGLVVTFVILGSSRVEPLDFWWGPLDVWLFAAYVVIVGGGLLITRRLHLLALAAAFWVTFALAMALLTTSGHCMTANWAFAPVCGFDYWRVVVFSPELMIFLFFMITEPRTVPSGRVGRIAFGVLVALASTLLMATQTDEFGAKVGLLAGLVVMCAARPLLERVLPEPRSDEDDPRLYMSRLAMGRDPRAKRARLAASVGVATLVAIAAGAGIVVAGTPARGVVLPDATEILNLVPNRIDAATLPPITVGQDVVNWDHVIAGPEMQQIALTLAENLALENQALLHRDPAILEAVDHGDRLIEMRGRLRDAIATGKTVLTTYHFDSLHVSLLVPFGRQDGLSLGFAARGTMTEEAVDRNGSIQGTRSSPFSLIFAVRRATGARWLNVAVLTHPPVG